MSDWDYWKSLSREELEHACVGFNREIKALKQQSTLRDQFAMAALPVAHDDLFFGEEGPRDASELARRAYAIADAMIAAREVKP